MTRADSFWCDWGGGMWSSFEFDFRIGTLWMWDKEGFAGVFGFFYHPYTSPFPPSSLPPLLVGLQESGRTRGA